jgi:hypothetical protein
VSESSGLPAIGERRRPAEFHIRLAKLEHALLVAMFHGAKDFEYRLDVSLFGAHSSCSFQRENTNRLSGN